MSDELKPCPFCGQAPVIQAYGEDEGPLATRYVVECQNEECTQQLTYAYKASAVDEWNKRPIEYDLLAKWERIPWDALRQAVSDLYEADRDSTYDNLEKVENWIIFDAPKPEVKVVVVPVEIDASIVLTRKQKAMLCWISNDGEGNDYLNKYIKRRQTWRVVYNLQRKGMIECNWLRPGEYEALVTPLGAKWLVLNVPIRLFKGD